MTGIATDFLAEVSDPRIIVEGTPLPRMGRPRAYNKLRPATPQERDHKRNMRESVERHETRLDCIAIWDTETDPFDNKTLDPKTGKPYLIAPFVGCLWSPNFEPIIIWEENEDAFYDKFIAAVEALPGVYTIYAHNGGNFDFMFMVHKLRGKVSFKGRGIMSAKIGAHELRDSFHIIPEKLANYHKEEFDYTKLLKKKRHANRKDIVEYLVSDCAYLHEVVRGFLDRFGFKISIGQAAMAEMRKVYKVGRIGAKIDETLREFFYGGRVECLAGRGHFVGRYKLYDVNSMYPAVMAQLQHPIGSHYIRRERGGIGPDTFFIELTCRNFGALVCKRKNPQTDEWETTTQKEYGRFKTTIWEYNMALKLGLIDKVKIHAVIDCHEKSDFSKFILPLYAEKAALKEALDVMKKAGDTTSQNYFECKRQYLFSKLIQNNAYGKFAQNPRNFKESFITGFDDPPPPGFEDKLLPFYRNPERGYAVWEKPAEKKQGFHNVGTAASITGGARALLMEAIDGAVDPIYCDTDSLICRSVSGIEIHESKLGAWDLEQEMDEVIIAGKKLYAYRSIGQEDKAKVKSKGASGITWADMVRLLDNQVVASVNKGVTLTKTGRQFYMTRRIRATAPIVEKTTRARAPLKKRVGDHL